MTIGPEPMMRIFFKSVLFDIVSSVLNKKGIFPTAEGEENTYDPDFRITSLFFLKTEKMKRWDGKTAISFLTVLTSSRFSFSGEIFYHKARYVSTFFSVFFYILLRARVRALDRYILI